MHSWIEVVKTVFCWNKKYSITENSDYLNTKTNVHRSERACYHLALLLWVCCLLIGLCKAFLFSLSRGNIFVCSVWVNLTEATILASLPVVVRPPSAFMFFKVDGLAHNLFFHHKILDIVIRFDIFEIISGEKPAGLQHDQTNGQPPLKIGGLGSMVNICLEFNNS